MPKVYENRGGGEGFTVCRPIADVRIRTYTQNCFAPWTDSRIFGKRKFADADPVPVQKQLLHGIILLITELGINSRVSFIMPRPYGRGH